MNWDNSSYYQDATVQSKARTLKIGTCVFQVDMRLIIGNGGMVMHLLGVEAGMLQHTNNLRILPKPVEQKYRLLLIT